VLALLVIQDIMIGLILALLPTLNGTPSEFTKEFMSAFLRLGIFGKINLDPEPSELHSLRTPSLHGI